MMTEKEVEKEVEKKVEKEVEKEETEKKVKPETEPKAELNTKIMQNNNFITEIKKKGFQWINQMLDCKLTYTKPGSISYLIYGEQPSEQSISIKLGRFGEYLSKELIEFTPTLQLLTCGVQNVNGKKKDIDLIFKDDTHTIIYYFELKANIELDTEKIPATVSKCNTIVSSLKEKYSNYNIICGILNWSVFDRKILTTGLSNIKTFETAGIKIYHMKEFLNIIKVDWDENDYYSYFREIGTKIRTKNANNEPASITDKDKNA